MHHQISRHDVPPRVRHDDDRNSDVHAVVDEFVKEKEEVLALWMLLVFVVVDFVFKKLLVVLH